MAMIYSNNLKEKAGKISPIYMVKYLQDLHWEELPVKRNEIRVFQLEQDNKFYQATVPMEKSLSDFDIAMLCAVEKLSESMNISVDRSLLLLLNPMSDILKVRVMNNAVIDGSIEIEVALKLFQNIKKLFMWTAMDVYQPQRYYRGRPPIAVQEMVNCCRWGQTEIGSYVISVICPHILTNENKITQLTLFDDKSICSESLTRKTMIKLLNSISLIKNSIYSLDKLFFDPASNISLNFLEALSNLNITEKESETEISAEWASTLTDTTLGFNSVTINHDFYEPIAAQIRRMRPPETTKKYTGWISKLSANENIESRRGGNASIGYASEDGGKMQYVSLKLAKEDYQEAVRAHGAGLPVFASCSDAAEPHRCNIFKVIEYDPDES